MTDDAQQRNAPERGSTVEQAGGPYHQRVDDSKQEAINLPCQRPKLMLVEL